MKEIKKTIPFSEAKGILQISRDISLMKFIKKVNIKIITKADSGLSEILLDYEDFCRALKIEELPEKFITIQEVADLLNLSVSKVDSLCHGHNLPFYRLDNTRGSKLLFVESELTGDSVDISLIKSTDFYVKAWKFDKYEEVFLCLLSAAKRRKIISDDESDVVSGLLSAGHSTNKIAYDLGVTKERISQLFQKGLKKLGRCVDNLSLENENLKRDYLKLETENSMLRQMVKDANREIPETFDGNNYFSIKIRDLEFSVRTFNSLRGFDIPTLGELANCKASDLIKIGNFGRKSLNEVNEVLAKYNLKLKDE